MRLSTPGDPDPCAPIEAVVHEVDRGGWAATVLDGAGRFAAVAVGPGLGRSEETCAQVRDLVAQLRVPVVIDGDGLAALGSSPGAVLAGRVAPAVLTPHDGEFERLTGAAPGEDRIGAARALASDTGATVLLKGPTTVVAAPDGSVLLVRWATSAWRPPAPATC